MKTISTSALRDEAHKTAADLDRRVYTQETLERTIVRLCRRLLDAADDLDLARHVAHASWHLLDDSGETGETDDNNDPFYQHMQLDHERVSYALDALEASGWNPHSKPADD